MQRDIATIKEEFPLLQKKDIVYFDSAATSQKPQCVLDAVLNFYTTTNANTHRSTFPLAQEATAALEQARKTIAAFINADPEEIIFTKNSTEGLNILAQTIKPKRVATTMYEHHSNYLPWKFVAEQFIVVDDPKEVWEQDVDLITITGMSNVTGLIPHVQTQEGKIVVIDACQLAPHQPIDVKKLDCDALVFSGHKMYGPLGCGILYVKKSLLDTLPPFMFGGGMVDSVAQETWQQSGQKFEAGTLDAASAVGTAKACEFIQSIGWDAIKTHEEQITQATIDVLRKHNATIYGHDSKDFGGIVSFTFTDTHAYDVAVLLGEQGICVRSGHHCAQPLLEKLGCDHVIRISIGIYNTVEDVERLDAVLTEILPKVKA